MTAATTSSAVTALLEDLAERIESFDWVLPAAVSTQPVTRCWRGCSRRRNAASW